jgi:hypothetical protein
MAHLVKERFISRHAGKSVTKYFYALYIVIRYRQSVLGREHAVNILYLSIFIPVAPTWRIGHPRNAVSLQFLNLRQSVGLLGWEISPSQGHYIHRKPQTQ